MNEPAGVHVASNSIENNRRTNGHRIPRAAMMNTKNSKKILPRWELKEISVIENEDIGFLILRLISI